MKSINGKKILVTGGAGFIGSNLCELLLQTGNRVVCLDNFLTGKRENIAPFLENPDFELMEGDIRDLSTCLRACESVDVVLHQAALGSVPRSVADPLTTHDINLSGFLNMLVAARDAKVKRFVYAASSSTYGDSKKLPKIEDEIGNPLSPYAVTKYANELYGRVFAVLYGMEIIGLRYFNVFGRRQRPDGVYAAVIPKFIGLLLEGKRPVIYGEGEQSRDFTYIDNVLQANVLAATTENPEALNQVFNVAFGERTTVNQMFYIVRNLLARHKPEIADFDPIYEQPRAGDIPHSLADISKAKKLLGYAPEYNMRQGLTAAIEWYVKFLGK
jgi:UDP-N-acetylglucosamine 4-epimerase